MNLITMPGIHRHMSPRAPYSQYGEVLSSLPSQIEGVNECSHRVVFLPIDAQKAPAIEKLFENLFGAQQAADDHAGLGGDSEIYEGWYRYLNGRIIALEKPTHLETVYSLPEDMPVKWESSRAGKITTHLSEEDAYAQAMADAEDIYSQVVDNPNCWTDPTILREYFVPAVRKVDVNLTKDGQCCDETRIFTGYIKQMGDI